MRTRATGVQALHPKVGRMSAKRRLASASVAATTASSSEPAAERASAMVPDRVPSARSPGRMPWTISDAPSSWTALRESDAPVGEIQVDGPTLSAAVTPDIAIHARNAVAMHQIRPPARTMVRVRSDVSLERARHQATAPATTTRVAMNSIAAAAELASSALALSAPLRPMSETVWRAAAGASSATAKHTAPPEMSSSASGSRPAPAARVVRSSCAMRARQGTVLYPRTLCTD